ncbi:Eugenol synthase 1 [Forsythia ovata]|uniref:Eugenol synthase 1 n=1 Tax=Forsythia ovata TaxID=205694 RepID=A0ABD1U5U1_9LAMI
MARNESKILIIAGTGYIGSYMVKASIKLGHPTYVYSRPNSSKSELLDEFESMGAVIVKGELKDHEKLVSVLKEVDVVISAVAYPQVLDQLKIIEAIKVAGGIKRFLPSYFGCEEDKISVLPPFQAFLDKKKKIRRAIEAANIPYTFVSANCFGAYFINYLLRPYEQREEITVYGSGQTKALPDPSNIPISILHGVFIKGVTMNFDIGENDIEASVLYPDLKFTTANLPCRGSTWSYVGLAPWRKMCGLTRPTLSWLDYEPNTDHELCMTLLSNKATSRSASPNGISSGLLIWIANHPRASRTGLMDHSP